MDLFKAMVATGRQHEFLVLLNGQLTLRENEIRSALRNLIPPANFLTFPVPRGCASIHRIPALSRCAEMIRENFVASLSPDVVHVSSVVEGLHEDVVTSIGLTAHNPPTAATLYDFIPLREKKTYLSSAIARAHYFEKIRSLKRADALLAISKFVADDVARLLPDYSGLTVNIRGGIGAQFKKLSLGSYASALRQKYCLSRKFLLYTASFDQRKNQAGLIEAFALLPEQIRKDYHLVFVGGGEPIIYERLLGLAEENGLKQGDVLFLGRVADEDLVGLYNLCSLFVFPPKFEGLGMPVLEAMSCGVPIIGSNTSSIPEVVGWEEALFDPTDTASIARKIEQALMDVDFRLESIDRGKRHLEAFQWSRSAEVALSTLEKIASKGNFRGNSDCSSVLRSFANGSDLLDGDAENVSECAVRIEVGGEAPWRDTSTKVGWVTSWGGRCGIASYSKYLIDRMRKKPIVYACYQGGSIGEEESRVVRCWDQGKSDYLIELADSVESHGTEVLHIQFNYGFFDFVALRQQILRWVSKGISVFMTLHSTLDQSDEPTYRLSYLYPALRLCQKLYVHSAHDLSQLAALGLESNVTLIPIGVPAIALHDGERLSSGPTIATYGFALPGKGLAEIVEAVGLMHQLGERVQLRMINAHYADGSGLSDAVIDEIQRAIERFEIGEYVELITDYLTDEESLAQLMTADIVVFPYTRTGESGSAAVRAGLIASQTVAVTPIPIFDDVREAVYQLPGCTPRELATGISELLRKLKARDPEVAKIQVARSRLVGVTCHENISSFLEEDMCRKAYFDVFRQVYSSHRDSVFMANGRWRNHSIVSEKAGLVCYGPYVKLPRGEYRATLSGDLGPADEGRAQVHLSSSTERLLTVPLRNAGAGTLCDFLFVVDRDLEAVEVLVELDQGSKLRLDGYSFFRKW